MRIIDKLIRSSARSQATMPLKDYFGRKLREVYYNAEVLHRIESKIQPLNMRITGTAPPRVNLLIPEINFASFYGGYMAKLHLAGKLIEAGHRVRLVVVDPCVYSPDGWRAAVRDYPGLEEVFDKLETAYQGDRKDVLEASDKDRFIATTWWTAYLADHGAKSIGGPPFVYLVQEYEPFTFPMGSYYAMARHSYTFAHAALFSSGLLKEFFELERTGVYDGRPGTPAAEHFENAIVAFDPAELDEALRGVGGASRRRRLLFYARPEAHASRNMFEVAFLALARAIEEGVFDDTWEFHGIGSSHGDIALPRGRTLKMLGKFPLTEYRKALLRYDAGLSLMYTPHPSLLPLDMAAAGMVVVTNTCINKTARRLEELSGNLLGAEPHIEGVYEGLKEACRLADDPGHRRAGATVSWANDWDQAFHPALMHRLSAWLE